MSGPAGVGYFSGGMIRRASSVRTVAAVAPEPKVQEGDGAAASGFPHMADMHTGNS